ncbi:MAG TPA: phage baseplate assembly protein V [Kofleriaceae bacterium]|nr:phage baseplate assembly protein V [Kofleriaceae bacterium]
MITDLASYFFHQARVREEEAGHVYEPVIGIVTDIKDEGKLCRVKVKIPSLPIQDNTWWATWVSIGAGKDRGWFSLPEVDDEVLIMFEHGDIGRPVIVGALWNGKDKPPSDNKDGKNKLRMFKSKSGNKVTLDDDKGTITLEDGGGKGIVTIDKTNKVTFEAKEGDTTYQAKDEVIILAKEISIESKQGTQFAIGSQGMKLTGKDVNIKAKGLIKIDAPKTELNGSASDAAKAEGTVEEVPDPLK